jgi:carboxypeptidase D
VPSRLIGSFVWAQEQAVTYPFVVANNNNLNLNASTLAQLEQMHTSCGYADFLNTYLQFPPPGPQPPKLFDYDALDSADCDAFDLYNSAAWEVNPCFNIYETNWVNYAALPFS